MVVRSHGFRLALRGFCVSEDMVGTFRARDAGGRQGGEPPVDDFLPADAAIAFLGPLILRQADQVDDL